MRSCAAPQVAKKVAVNAAGQVTGTISATQPVAGDNLVASINSRVQADTERALGGAIHRAQAEGNLCRDDRRGRRHDHLWAA